MRKRHMNNDFTTHSLLYRLQNGLDGTSIQMVPLKRTNRGLRCNGMDYIRNGTPQNRGGTPFKKKDIERESTTPFYKHITPFY